MALKVQYTDTFEYTFKVLIEFLKDNWGDEIAGRFVKETEKTIQLIASFPNMYKVSSFDNEVRVAQIKKLSSLFYGVKDNQLTLLYIVDSRQEPFWL